MLLWLLVGSLCFFSINSFADNKTPSASSSTQLSEVDVIGELDQARDNIEPSLGGTDYTIGTEQIDDEAQGDNASFNQVILRTPGAAQDSFGQLHIRGEHANLQYDIDGVVLPEGVTGFGQELDTRFIQSVSLIDGSLPAQYGWHTAGIVDIQTKDGTFNNGGTISMYSGSHGEENPSLSYGGSAAGGINYYVTSSYLEDDLGIENPTNAPAAIHDETQQGKMFAYVSKVIDDTSRLSIMLGASHSDFQIPNSPNGVDYFTTNNLTNPGFPIIPSQDVDDRQIEQNFYGIVTYQKSQDGLNYQLSAFTRFSEVQYLPDDVGDLDYNGVAATVNDSILDNGLQWDGSYELNDTNTLRGGTTFMISDAIDDNDTLGFPVDGSGNPTSAIPESIVDNNQKQGEQYGLYLQDETVINYLTLNWGGRFDQSYQYLNQYQFSPRVNAVYELDQSTKVHGGYARYFTPPPFELEQNGNPAIYNGTTAQLLTTQNSPIQAERSNYFDLGMAHDFSAQLHSGIDGYYKLASQQLDEGQFGTAPIFVPFNYKYGKVDGIEFTNEYKNGGLSIYSNTALSASMGRDIDSAQFQDTTPGELQFIQDHWIYMDHNQFITGSGGIAYKFNGSPYALLNKTKISADILYGSGLRSGFANTGHTGFYNPVNLGLEHTIHLPNFPEFKVRFDIVNLTDEIYELRDGTGVGVYAPQYGPRRGYYGGFSMDF